MTYDIHHNIWSLSDSEHKGEEIYLYEEKEVKSRASWSWN